MTVLRRSLELPYRANDLFDLVSDVGRYPDFIRWIQSLRVIDEQEEGTRTTVRAEATVGFLTFTERFTTDVAAERDGRNIEVSLVRGPFRRLKNTWSFAPTEGGTRIDFLIDFQFRNFVLQALAAANLDFAVQRIIEAFQDEAARRYTKVSAAQPSV